MRKARGALAPLGEGRGMQAQTLSDESSAGAMLRSRDRAHCVSMAELGIDEGTSGHASARIREPLSHHAGAALLTRQ